MKRSSLDGVVSEVGRIGEGTTDRLHGGSAGEGGHRGLTWLTNDRLVYTPDSVCGLFSIASSGGTPEPLTTIDEQAGERTHRWPAALPGGRAVLFTVGRLGSPDNYDESAIEAVDVATRKRQVVRRGASSARYVGTGHLLFARAASVYAVPFDVDRRTTTGTPVKVLSGVSGDPTTGALHLSVADDGTAAYAPGSAQAVSSRLMWADRTGAAQALPLPEALFFEPRPSPDGTHLAVAMSRGTSDIWVSDLTRSTFTRLSFCQSAATPVWSGDGRTVYYSFLRPDGRGSVLLRRPADGSREPETVVVLDNARVNLQAIDRDERWALVDYRPFGHLCDIVKVALTANARPEPVVATAFDDFAAAPSPEGRWLAYASNETGRFEVYMRDLSGTAGRRQLSTMGGQEPHWSGDGRTIYYRNSHELMSVAVGAEGNPDPKPPVRMFEGLHDLRSEGGISYAVDPRSERFLMSRLAAEPEQVQDRFSSAYAPRATTTRPLGAAPTGSCCAAIP